MLDEHIRAIRRDYDGCFGCGIANDFGLHIDGFRTVGNTVLADFTPHENHRGFADLLHGGVVAAALDEIMAWTAILQERVMVMTANLQLRYRNPANVAARFTMAGDVVERSGRRLRMTGRMLDGENLVAEAQGLFLAITELDAG